MGFHQTNFGSFANFPHVDMNGFVPVEGDRWEDFCFESSQSGMFDEEGELTEKGEWWEDRFNEMVNENMKALAEAEEALNDWRDNN